MLDQLEQLKRTVEELRRKIDRARGAEAQLAKTAREKYGAKTLEKMKAVRERKRKEREAKAEEYVRAYRKFEKDHAGELDDE